MTTNSEVSVLKTMSAVTSFEDDVWIKELNEDYHGIITWNVSFGSIASFFAGKNLACGAVLSFDIMKFDKDNCLTFGA